MSRRHFDNGLKLYRDGNYRGALVEFQAANDLSPSAGAQRNVALCQKALFRYDEAARTLERLLDEQGPRLSERDRAAMRAAIAELEGLVGSVVVLVTPTDATVSVAGRNVDPKERLSGLRLNVGEHTITAQAPGYATLTRVVSVAGGQQGVPIELVLEPTMGFLSVATNDPDAAIAIDGEALAFHRWSGPLPPGRHLVQIYKDGHEPYERRVRLELGRTLELVATIGPPTGEPTPAHIRLETPPPPPIPRAGFLHQGWYAVATINVLALGDAPRGMEHTGDTASAEVGGATAGLRAGYRILAPVAAEALIEGGGFPVNNACDELEAGPSCSDPDAMRREYLLTTVRLGANLRLLSAGEKLRFASSFGSGSVRHQLVIPAVDDAELAALPGAEPKRSAEGWNPYFLLEVGAELNLRHFLLGAAAQICVDSTAHTLGGDGFRPYSGLVLGGLALRMGWSEWAPRRRTQSRPPPGFSEQPR